jgi:hypothetical protein
LKSSVAVVDPFTDTNKAQRGIVGPGSLLEKENSTNFKDATKESKVSFDFIFILSNS